MYRIPEPQGWLDGSCRLPDPVFNAQIHAGVRVSVAATGTGRRPLTISFIIMRRIVAAMVAPCGRVIEPIARPVSTWGIGEEGMAVSG